MSQPPRNVIKPTAIERLFNRVFGALTAAGLTFQHNFVLECRGRLSGRLLSTPVNLLEFAGEEYLVAPRGVTQWVRNLRHQPTASLRRGRQHRTVRLEELDVATTAPILREYLRRFAPSVGRYFDVEPSAGLSDFCAAAPNHPVFVVRAD